MNKKNARNASFSLVEAILAMTILGIAVTGILTTFSSSLLMGKLSEDYSLVSTLMGELHANVRTNQFSPFETNEGTFTNHPEMSWTVTFYYTDVTDLYQVEMEIKWTRGSRVYSLKHTTYHFYQIADTSSQTVT